RAARGAVRGARRIADGAAGDRRRFRRRAGDGGQAEGPRRARSVSWQSDARSADAGDLARHVDQPDGGVRVAAAEEAMSAAYAIRDVASFAPLSLCAGTGIVARTSSLVVRSL